MNVCSCMKERERENADTGSAAVVWTMAERVERTCGEAEELTSRQAVWGPKGRIAAAIRADRGGEQ